MRKHEQDYPTRADFAAALRWWEIFIISAFRTGMVGVSPPEHFGRAKCWLARNAYATKPDGTFNFGCYWLVPVGVAPPLVVGAAFWGLFGIWAAVPGGVVGLIPIIVINFVSQELWFRAGGWEQVLEKRAQKSARRDERRLRRSRRTSETVTS